MIFTKTWFIIQILKFIADPALFLLPSLLGYQAGGGDGITTKCYSFIRYHIIVTSLRREPGMDSGFSIKNKDVEDIMDGDNYE